MGMYFIYVAILFGTMSKSDGQDEDDEDDDDGNDEDNKSILCAFDFGRKYWNWQRMGSLL